MESATNQEQGTYITPAHAAALSEQYWGEGKGRSRQAFMRHLKKIRHIQSEEPPSGQKQTLLLKADVLAFDQSRPPIETTDKGVRAAQRARAAERAAQRNT